ncbi:hypothetical protein BDQ17DRAFT_1387043 [Cyathus striatus]|nr:hypothetical protein BDQ17DRAFT_1387043 [Cyathus striatus]
MDLFTPDKDLLNPKFEGYRLDRIPQDDAIARYTLQHKPTQATVSGKIPLSFQEVQSRITHNHLAVSSDAGCAVYVDADYKVILINLGADRATPTFRVIHELPTPVQSFSAVTLQREYPSIAFLSETSIIVADGCGSLYIFSVRDNGPSDAIGTYTLSVESAEIPFRLHDVHRISATSVVVILSSRFYSQDAPPRSSKQQTPIYFDIRAAKIDLLSLVSSKKSRPFDIIWHRRGMDVPIYASFIESLDSHVLLGGSIYKDLTITAKPTYEPSPDEIAPIPRPGEDLDFDIKTSDSVTVAFLLPSDTPKNNIKVLFSPHTLTLHVDTVAPTCTLWDGISTTSSVWTWDREAEHAYGLLTLHLEKQNEGTRWMQVFSSAAIKASSEAGPDEEEVPETLDPSELWHIRESLEKYTAALRTGEDASVPSLAENEMDEEVDSSVGRTAYFTWVTRDGVTPSWSKNDFDIPFQLLSMPMPGLSPHFLSLIVKSNVDGSVFTLMPPQTSEGSPEWKHTSTYSALAFVLASKQDTRFTYHIPKKAVLAFEGGTKDRGGNVYVYRASPVKEKWAKQAILKVNDGSCGALLGVGAISLPNGNIIVICLTEGELVLIKGI